MLLTYKVNTYSADVAVCIRVILGGGREGERERDG